jgi:hypothetical protein
MAFESFPQEGDDVQKKTCTLTGLAVAMAGGVLLTGSPANAQSTLVQWRRHHHHSRHYSVNRNTNFNRNRNRVVVRVHVHNSNRNVAIADRERDDDFGLFRRHCRFDCFRRFDDDRFGRDDDDRDGGDRIIVGNDFRSLGSRD